MAGAALALSSATLAETGLSSVASSARPVQFYTSATVDMPIRSQGIPIESMPEAATDLNAVRAAAYASIMATGTEGFTLDGRRVTLHTLDMDAFEAIDFDDFMAMQGGDLIQIRDAERQANCACPFGDCVVPSGPNAINELTASPGAEPPCNDPGYDRQNNYCVGPTPPAFQVASALPIVNINAQGTYTICGQSGVVPNTTGTDFDTYRLLLNGPYSLQVTAQYDQFGGRFSLWYAPVNSACGVLGAPLPDCVDLPGYCVIASRGVFGGFPGAVTQCSSAPLLVDGSGNPAPVALPAGEYGLFLGAAFANTLCTSWYNATITVTAIPQGACCTGATCTLTTLSNCLTLGGVYRGNDTTCSPNPCCAVSASGVDFTELEGSCATVQNPDLNGGCITGGGFEIFEADFSTNPCDLSGSAVIRGTFGTRDTFLGSTSSGFVVDIDAYAFTLDQRTQVTVTVFSNAPFNAFLNQGSNDPNDPIVCGEDITVASIANATACGTGISMTACLDAGTHYIDIFPAVIDGAFQGVSCGTPYRIEITCAGTCNTGACALPNGTCSDGVALPDCIDAGGVYFGDDSTCMDDAVFCDVCNGGSVASFDDVCADFTDDSTNGGCFEITPAFTDLTPFITGPVLSWCGSAGVQVVDDGAGGFVALGDDDWYEFTLTGTQFVTFSVEANANVFISIVPNLGLLTCASIDPDSTITGVAYTVCDSDGPAEISACLPAGTHSLLVRGQSRPCGFRYSATLSFNGACPPGACCLPNGSCQQASEVVCNNSLGGIFAGIGVDCMDAGCCDFNCPMGAVVENEPACGDDYDDNFNGGCNSNPVVFQSIAYSNPVSFCGAGGTFFDNSDPQNPVALRDTDWITVDLPAGAYRFSFDSNFSAQVNFYTSRDPGPPPVLIDIDCDDPGANFFFGVNFTRCVGGTVGWTFFADLRLTVALGALGTVPCSGDDWRYSFTITRFDNVVGACCIPDEDEPTGVRCQDSVTQAACIADFGGVFNQDECCDNIVCDPIITDPEGSCCFACSGGSQLPCFEATQGDCTAAGGTYLGDNTTCATFNCSNLCSGDINGDNRTNLDDFIILAGNFGGVGNRPQGDLNCSNTVNLDDFIVLAGDFGCDKTALFP